MSGGLALQLALDSLATAAIYALVGLGVYLAHSGTRVLHLAIGEVAMLGALVAAGLSASWPLIVAVPVGLAVAGVASGATERVLVAPFARRIEVAAIVLIAGAVVLREVLRGLFSRSAYPFPSVGGVLHPAGGTVRSADLLTIAVVAAVGGAATLVLRRTLVGASLRATAAAPDSAELIGVDIAAVRTAAFAVAGVLAAGAMMLAAGRLPLAASAGAPLALKGIAAAVAGRLRSPLSVAAGALVIGTAQVVAGYFLGSGGELVSDAVALLLLVMGLRR